MYKAIKTTIKEYFLKKRLKKDERFFSIDTLPFKEKNVLIIDSIIPEYNKDSGSRRLYELIKLMLKQDVQLFLMADIKLYKYKSAYIKAFEDLGVFVYQPSLDTTGKLVTKEAFITALAPKLQYAWLHRPDVFHGYHKLIKSTNSKTKLIFDMVDFHYIRLLREWEQSKDVSVKQDADKYFRIELDNCKASDTIIAISNDDKQSLLQHYSDANKIEVSKRDELLFVGSFRHKPNQDAVTYLKNEIMPLVWQQLPNIVVNIVGSYADETIKALHTEKFNVIGFVEDISQYYKTARVFVAPLLYGAGVKGKIGQSFEYSLPVVTTAVGAEGFDFSPYQADMIAETPHAIADLIVKLYTDDLLFNAISKHSKEILKPFSLAHIERQVKQVLDLH